MDSLFRKSDRLLANTQTEIIRDKMNEIHWNAQLVTIMGAKGVGKSTLIKQYLKQNYRLGDHRILYCSADTVDFSMRTLVGLAEDFSIHGGELLAIDEIHKYKSGTTDWSREIKEIHELYPDLKLIVSGSSLLRLREGDADLSRRAVKYTMPGLSFRESIRFYHGLEFKRWALEDILAHPYDLWQEVSSKCKPVVLFKEYLEKGYYPFLLEGEGEYYTKIEQVVNYIIEAELPQICKVDVANVRKLQALIALICSEVPFELNANKIAAAIEIGRDTAISFGVTITDNNYHPTNPADRRYMRHTPHRSEERSPKYAASAPIRIGENVLLGSGSRICKGVTIGDNAIVAANAVVTHDVPANAIAAGNPARIVKEHIDETTISIFPLRK